MYSIVNKKVEIKGLEIKNETGEIIKTGETTYKNLLELCNLVTPKEGWTPAEQRKSLRVDAALEKHKENKLIEMESSDFEYIKQKVETCPWTIKDKAIVEFSDYIRDLKEEK